MQADLEAPVGELAEDAVVNRIVAGDDVERGAEAALLFEICQLERESKPVSGLDVVGQNQGSVVRPWPEPCERCLFDLGVGKQTARIKARQPIDGELERPAWERPGSCSTR